MGAGKNAEALEEDRSLVTGARIWLAVSPIVSSSCREIDESLPNSATSGYTDSFKLIRRVAYNHSRPLAFVEDNILQLARGLLKHPLSKLSDSRFVVSVELMACRRESWPRIGESC